MSGLRGEIYRNMPFPEHAFQYIGFQTDAFQMTTPVGQGNSQTSGGGGSNRAARTTRKTSTANRGQISQGDSDTNNTDRNYVSPGLKSFRIKKRVIQKPKVVTKKVMREAEVLKKDYAKYKDFFKTTLLPKLPFRNRRRLEEIPQTQPLPSAEILDFERIVAARELVDLREKLEKSITGVREDEELIMVIALTES